MMKDLTKEFLIFHFLGIYNYLKGKIGKRNKNLSPVDEFYLLKALYEAKIALANLKNDISYLEGADEIRSRMNDLGRNIEGSKEIIEKLKKWHEKTCVISGEKQDDITF